MSGHSDPATVLQRAWGELKLPRLQQLVDETITSLNTVEPEQLLGRDLSELEMGFPQNPVKDALEACCAELREECGMLDSTVQRADQGELVRHHLAEYPRWKATFCEALEKYRELAGRMLELACHAAPVDPGDDAAASSGFPVSTTHDQRVESEG